MTDQAFEPERGAFTEQSAGIAPGTRLAIVRHGEAVCNVEDLIGGHEGCRGLTKRGVRQAEVLAERLRRTGEAADAAALWTSVLPRAMETAEIIAPSLGDLPVQRSCGLCERHPGEADGLSWSEYEERYSRVSLPGDAPELPLSPGGESWIDFIDRASASLSALANAHPGQLLVVVAHGGVIDASVIRFLGLPDHGQRVRLHPDHTSITEWEHTGTRWRFARYNDASHLAGPDADELRTPAPDWVGRDLPD